MDSGRIHLIAPMQPWPQIVFSTSLLSDTSSVAKDDKVTNVNLRGLWLLMFGFRPGRSQLVNSHTFVEIHCPIGIQV